MIKKLIFSLLFIPTLSYSNDWIQIPINNAFCGDGKPYKIFLSKGRNDKVFFELMGGGACWDYKSCWGPSLKTWIHPIPSIPSFSYLTSNHSPTSEYTKVYFPYCSGDVWVGDHTAYYETLFKTKKTFHWGKRNFHLALEQLDQDKILNFQSIDSFLLSGSSAGAIGAMANLQYIDQKLSPNSRKILLADSPGLHWNRFFWNKFTNEQLIDFQNALINMDMPLDFNNGILAKDLDNFCEKNLSWNMAFIQSTKDIIMSKLFGEMSMNEHRNNVLGPIGLKETLKVTKNCASHIPDSFGHAFLLSKKYSENNNDIETNESIRDFVDNFIKLYN